MSSDTGTQFAYLAETERVLAAADMHMAVCDAPTVFECPECDRKLTKYRKYLRVLADAGLLVRAGHSETRPPLPLDMGIEPCETPMPGRPDLHCERPFYHNYHGANGTDGIWTFWLDTYTPAGRRWLAGAAQRERPAPAVNTREQILEQLTPAAIWSDEDLLKVVGAARGAGAVQDYLRDALGEAGFDEVVTSPNDELIEATVDMLCSLRTERDEARETLRRVQDSRLRNLREIGHALGCKDGADVPVIIAAAKRLSDGVERALGMLDDPAEDAIERRAEADKVPDLMAALRASLERARAARAERRALAVDTAPPTTPDGSAT